MSLTQILLEAQSSDSAMRERAQAQIDAAQNGNIEQYLGSLMQELSDESKPEASRQLAGSLLKNTMVSRDAAKRLALGQRWLAVNPDTRNEIKRLTQATLKSPHRFARMTAALVAATIASVEIPVGQWQEFVPQLCQAAQQKVDAPLRDGALLCLGYICEEVGREHLLAASGDIITAVVTAMSKEEPNPDIRLQGTKALNNTLELSSGVMDDPANRPRFMQVICEAASLSIQPQANTATRLEAMQCLVKVVALYYDKMNDYMQALFNLSVEAIQKDAEEIALQGLEFWTTMCEVEQELLEMLSHNMKPPMECMYYVKGATKFLVPILWECLLKKDENTSEDDWNVSHGAGICIQAMSCTIGDDIVQEIMPLVNANISRTDSWRHVEAATLAFGSILEGTQPNGPLSTALDTCVMPLLAHMQVPVHLIKETTAWCIGRIAEFHCEKVKGKFIEPVLQCMAGALMDPEPRIASKACYAILQIAQGCGDLHTEAEHNELSPYVGVLTTELLKTIDRPDSSQASLRASAWEALNAVVAAVAHDCLDVVRQLLPALLLRLENSMQHQPANEDQARQIAESQGLLCALLHYICRKMKGDMRPMADKIMTSLLHLLTSQNSEMIQAEALMAAGAVAACIQGDFAKYMPHLFEPLLAGLRNFQAASVCSVAVVTLGDVLNAGSIAPEMCDRVMQTLLEGLKTPELDKDIKPRIINTFGDVALNVDTQFEKYLGMVMTVIATAANKVEQEVQADPSNEVLVNYQVDLQENICSCYTDILLSMAAKKQVFQPHLRQVFDQIGHIGKRAQNLPPSTIASAISVLGDIMHVYGASAKPFMNTDGIQLLFQFHQTDPEVQKATQYAQKEWKM